MTGNGIEGPHLFVTGTSLLRRRRKRIAPEQLNDRWQISAVRQSDVDGRFFVPWGLHLTIVHRLRSKNARDTDLQTPPFGAQLFLAAGLHAQMKFCFPKTLCIALSLKGCRRRSFNELIEGTI